MYIYSIMYAYQYFTNIFVHNYLGLFKNSMIVMYVLNFLAYTDLINDISIAAQQMIIE